MILGLQILTLACVALAAPQYEPVSLYYHEGVGIPKAARIEAVEKARDFDGARIVGGSVANPGQFSYFGGLLISLASGVTSVCGSSLLTNTKLVTAAQCWFDGQNQGTLITVVLGSTRLFSGGVRVTSSQVEVHRNYNFLDLNNNVAMITIPWTPYDVNINPIDFAHGSNQYIGQQATAVGFGRTSDDEPITTSQVLHHVTMPVLPNAACRSVFGALVTSSTLCTDTAGGRGVCAGDMGGPLAVDGTLVGVSSFIAAAGCSSGLPAGFSRVSSFATWMDLRL